jgi:YjbE family integral membrane protein
VIHLGHSSALIALLQVILIDLTLAGDNAVVIGIAAAQIPPDKRSKAIFWGLAIAVILRVILATLTATILSIIGLMFAGGFLLLWVSWRLWRDLNPDKEDDETPPGELTREYKLKTVRRALLRIVLADLSMSLDNVLAVAGAALNHVWVLTIGLVLSVALMGLAASFVAKLLTKHPWISYAGLILVIYVALRMIWFGGIELWQARNQIDDNNKAVASSEVLKRGNFTPSASFASMARNSSPSAARPFVWYAAISPSASYAL